MALSTERYNNYNFIQHYLSNLSPAEKIELPPGIIQIDETHTFYVKNTTHHNELLMHSQLTDLAIVEHFGGILLLFGYSDSYLKDEQQTYNLFIELSDGEDSRKAQAKIEVIPSLLWMHAHNYNHGDIYNNNIFRLGSIHVIGDFDTTTHHTKIKTSELSRFLECIPDKYTSQFNHLYITIPGDSPRLYLKGGTGIIGRLGVLIRGNERLLETHSDNKSMVEHAENNLAQYRSLLDEMETIRTSPELYMDFANALKHIYAESHKTGGKRRYSKKNLKKTRKTRQNKNKK